MAKVLSNDLLRVKPKNGSQELKIVLPLGVSVNKLYTMFRGRKQISNEGKKYIRTVVPVIMQNIKNLLTNIKRRAILIPTNHSGGMSNERS